MLTSRESASRTERLQQRISSSLGYPDALGTFASDISITLQESAVILDGTLPQPELIERIIPSIRRAGVMARIDVRVMSSEQA